MLGVKEYKDVKEIKQRWGSSHYDVTVVSEKGEEWHATFSKEEYEYRLKMLELKKSLSKDLMKTVQGITETRYQAGYDDGYEECEIGRDDS